MTEPPATHPNPLPLEGPQRLWAWGKRVVLRLGLIYLGLCVMLAFVQRQLMYQPRRGPVTREQADRLAPQIREVTIHSHDGLTLNGWLCLVDGTSPRGETAPLTGLGAEGRPLVLMFAGNAGNRATRLSQLDLFTGLGCDALLVDYRGYGGNPGTPSEADFYADARSVWDHVTQQWGFAPGKIVISGESLGGGVAVHLASERCAAGQSPAALILRATFTSMVDAASYNYPWLPVRWILIDRYESVRKIPTVDCPLLVYHGPEDRIIPFEQGQRLFAEAPEKSRSGVSRRFLEVAGAGHNDIFQVGNREITAAIAELLASVRSTDR